MIHLQEVDLFHGNIEAMFLEGPSIYYVRTEVGGGSVRIGILRTGAYGGEGVQTDAYIRIAIDACIATKLLLGIIILPY